MPTDTSTELKSAVWDQARIYRSGLSTAVWNHSRRDPLHKLGVGTGWAGPKTLFSEYAQATQRLQQFIQSALPEESEWRLIGWGSIMESTDVIRQHDHVENEQKVRRRIAEYAGCYYVDTPAGCGPICFDGELPITPTAGLLLIWPVHLMHEVKTGTHTKGTHRVSIAFNAIRAE